MTAGLIHLVAQSDTAAPQLGSQGILVLPVKINNYYLIQDINISITHINVKP